MQDDLLDELVAAVRVNPRYQSINQDFIRRVGGQELLKRHNVKEAVKATRSKLHQVGAAYQERPIDYKKLQMDLDLLDPDLEKSALKEFCLNAMMQHTSSRERLPYLDDFFIETLSSIGPIHSILDLACGFNPLALPWMPMALDVEYYACDIYEDMAVFISNFINKAGVRGFIETCDLSKECPSNRVQLAFLLKALPCLDQLDKNIGQRLIHSIQADHILVSYPIRSLGGKSKGMLQFYEQQFLMLIAGINCDIHRFVFSNELVFRLDLKGQ